MRFDFARRMFLGLMGPIAAVAMGLCSGEVRADTALPPPEIEHGCLKLGFDRLAAFKFVIPAYDPVADAKNPPTGEEQIPAGVKAWSGKEAVITGFMLPTKLENGKATEFLIMANQMACCFGTVPNMNEWVVVRMPQGTEVIQDVPISFHGVLRVGAMFENGYMTGIYEMDAAGEAKTD